MNIVLIPSHYWPRKGGLEMSTLHLAIQLKKRGHKIKVITNRYPYYLKSEEITDRITVERLHFPFFQFQSYAIPTSGVRRLLLPFYSFFKLAYSIIRTRPQIVNLHYVSAQSIYVTLLLYILSFKYVVSLHGLGLQELPKAPRYESWVYRWVLRKADAITSCSKALLDDAKKRVSGIEHKSVVIHNSAALEEFNSPATFEHHTPYILAVGNFYIYKGFDLLIMAFSHIAEAHNVDLIIAGDGRERNNLEEFTQLLGLKERVHFFGTAQRDEVVSLLNGCEFLAIPSRIEPFGIVILEAMAAGKAVVAYNVDGIPEIIKDGFNGFLVKPMSDKALADSMKRLLEDKPLRDRLAKNGHWLVKEQFSLDKQAEAFLSVYEAVSGKR